MAPQLSIVIPAYDEAKRLPNTLKRIQEFLNPNQIPYEIIVVDDGSRDNTLEVAKAALEHTPHLLLSYGENRGKGYCVRKGMLAASGKYILFTDADLSTPIEEIDRMIPYLEKGYDLVIGSRALPDGEVRRDMLWYREIMGRTYNLLGQMLLFPGISDSQCGFKCFKQDVACDLFSRQKLNDFSFDGEILYLARKCGYRIKELAVNWYQDPTSRVKLVQDSVRMFLDLVKIRHLHRSDFKKEIKP